MKVIHVPFGFRPDPVGGTEVYVEALAREQQRRGVDVVVAAPGRESTRHMDNGLPISRFGVSGTHDLASLYGSGDEQASQAFGQIVEHEQPDLVHLHAFSSAVSTRLAESTRRRGVRLVFTYHTPTVSCQRGTLLRWGRDVCDGRLDVHTCASCTLHGLGVGRSSAVLMGALPTAVGQLVGELGLAGGAWTGLRMTDLVKRQHAAFRSFMQVIDRVVVLCDWVSELLVRNGVAHEKLVVSRHGVPHEAQPMVRSAERPGPLRIAFLGRLHPTKGLDILLRALAGLPGAALQLDVFGIVGSEGESAYVRSLHALAAYDARIRFCPPVASERITALLRDYDVVAVPSRWLETGPLVVLEAFAAGVPVLGARLGGIAELVDDGTDGVLVEPDNMVAWRAALRQLAVDPSLVARLRAGVRPPRQMAAVAEDMLSAYRDLLCGR